MPNPNLIIVDDRDSSVSYSSTGWIQDGETDNYNGTSMFPVGQNATVRFAFVGTAIEVYGTVSPSAFRQRYMFSIDNGTAHDYETPAVSVQTFHQKHFSQSGLSDGEHTLVIQSYTDTGGQRISSLDYLVYTESDTTPVDGSTVNFVDETDSRVKYEGQWRSNSTAENFGGSSRLAGVAESQADFSFFGKSVSVYGAISNTAPSDVLQCSFAVDGGSPNVTQYTSPSTTVSFNQRLFQSDVLNTTEHTLTVKLLNDQPLSIDYFLVEPGVKSRPTPTNKPSSDKAIRVGTIVRSVIGAAVGLGAIIALLLACRWIRSRQRKRNVALEERSELVEVPRA